MKKKLIGFLKIYWLPALCTAWGIWNFFCVTDWSSDTKNALFAGLMFATAAFGFIARRFHQ